jgi:hypothetical protein
MGRLRIGREVGCGTSAVQRLIRATQDAHGIDGHLRRQLKEETITENVVTEQSVADGSTRPNRTADGTVRRAGDRTAARRASRRVSRRTVGGTDQ